MAAIILKIFFLPLHNIGKKMIKKTLLSILITLGLFNINIWAVTATEIWPSTVNVTTDINMKGIVYNENDVTLTGTSITHGSDTTCQFIPADVNLERDCLITNTSRLEINASDVFGTKDLANIDPSVPANVIDNNDVGTVQQPGDYFSLDISGSTITLAPGDYFFYEFLTDATSSIQAEGSTGTVKIYVQDKLIISSSHINTVIRTNSNDDPDFGLNSSTQTPDRFQIYTTATGNKLNASKAAIVGFLYVDGDSTNSNYFIWGAVSAANFGLQNNGWILNGTDYTPFITSGPGIQNGKLLPAGWSLIGIPALMDGNQTFNDVFNEPEFGTNQGDPIGWWAYERTFSTTDNTASYSEVIGTDNPVQSQGYWLYNTNEVNWTVDGLRPVVWDIPTGTDQCTSANKCKSYTLTMPSVGCAVANSGGPYRYNYIGYPGITQADWADFRIAVTDSNGTRAVYKPGDAAVATYMSTQIWQYNGTPDTTSNAYGTCNNIDINSCLIEPYTGFLLELNCSLVDDGVQSIELIIPNGQ